MNKSVSRRHPNFLFVEDFMDTKAAVEKEKEFVLKSREIMLFAFGGFSSAFLHRPHHHHLLRGALLLHPGSGLLLPQCPQQTPTAA